MPSGDTDVEAANRQGCERFILASKYAPASPPSEITIGATEALIVLSGACRFTIARVSARDFMGDPIDLSFPLDGLKYSRINPNLN